MPLCAAAHARLHRPRQGERQCRCLLGMHVIKLIEVMLSSSHFVCCCTYAAAAAAHMLLLHTCCCCCFSCAKKMHSRQSSLDEHFFSVPSVLRCMLLSVGCLCRCLLNTDFQINVSLSSTCRCCHSGVGMTATCNAHFDVQKCSGFSVHAGAQVCGLLPWPCGQFPGAGRLRGRHPWAS